MVKGRATTYYQGPHYADDYLPIDKHDLDETEPRIEDFSESPTKIKIEQIIVEAPVSSSGGTDTANLKPIKLDDDLKEIAVKPTAPVEFEKNAASVDTDEVIKLEKQAQSPS